MTPDDAQVATRPAFSGFRPAALTFFEQLTANQNREWFAANKAVYESEVLHPLNALVGALTFAFATEDVPLAGDPSRSVFRIYRDVRFSKDKSPYKTHAGAILSRDGTKSTKGMLYLHIATGGAAFAGLGFYHPDPNDLAAIRQAMVGAPDRWQSVEASMAEAGLALSRNGAKTRLPRGFEAQAGTPLAEVLKLPSLIVSRPLPNERLFQAGVVDDIVAFALAGLPLLRFGWSALDRAPR